MIRNKYRQNFFLKDNTETTQENHIRKWRENTTFIASNSMLSGFCAITEDIKNYFKPPYFIPTLYSSIPTLSSKSIACIT